MTQLATVYMHPVANSIYYLFWKANSVIYERMYVQHAYLNNKTQITSHTIFL